MHVVYGILFSYCTGWDCRFSVYLFLLHFCTQENFLTGIYEILTVSSYDFPDSGLLFWILDIQHWIWLFHHVL